ncbi:MAG: phosphonate C-P lyase system protein PhnH [Hyphomicrobiales bacterium]|nr:MAG: phosphonate C-P lyase system protein PhnH [Hyphomicrobiales bacterium]
MEAHASQTLLPGFADPVADAQRAFKAVMQAMSRPARAVPFEVALTAPAPLSPVVAAMLLALADYETPIWLDVPLRNQAVVQFLSFHSGARIVREPEEAVFAVASDPATMPPLMLLRQGTPEYPDRSTTLIVQVAALRAEGLRFEGPGIKREAQFSFPGAPSRFAAELAANRAQFPCGVDLIFAAPGAIAALPRSVRLVKEA